MTKQRLVTTFCVTLITCACAGSLWAGKSSTPRFDKAAIISDLNIADPNRNPYVTLDEWLAEAPKPPKGLSDERRAGFYRAWTTLWINTQPAKGAWIRPTICPGDNYRHGIWIWDSAFHIMGLLHGGPKARQLALWQIEVMLSGQHETGKIPREIWREGPQFLGQYGVQAPGLLTMCANRLLQVAESDEERENVRSAMSDFYPRFVRNHEWFFENPTLTEIGLCIWEGWDSGWDTSTRWDNPMLGAVDLSSFLYVDRVELAKMARAIGKRDEARRWDIRAAELRSAIRKLHWSQEMGIFNDVSADESISDTITPAIYWPLWAGVATNNQAIVATQYLEDPKMFAAEWPAPSVALGDPRFRQESYWRGPTWVNLNWITIRGLQRCGQKAAAATLREKTLDLVARTPVIYEYYDPLTGKGLGSNNYGWTAALYVDLVLEP